MDHRAHLRLARPLLRLARDHENTQSSSLAFFVLAAGTALVRRLAKGFRSGILRPGTEHRQHFQWPFDFHQPIGAALPKPTPSPMKPPVGVWRSLVAHLLWEQRVVSSNLTTPTNKSKGYGQGCFLKTVI